MSKSASKTYFEPVNPQINFPQMEEEMLQFWKSHKTFEKSIETKPEDKKWNFLDGPPFITGMPHYGSLLSSIPKDVYGRYWTMKGYRVRRVWGWDGHGLPIENKVENKLHIERKRDIEDKIGVKKFIEECLSYVNEVSGEWEWYVDHVGRWVDFENAYKTWDLDYMESVMWVFKGMYDKGFIYKGLRVSTYCPHCATPISNFEVAMDADNYKDITEPANTYKYKLADEDKTYFLAWSTTPWNKIVTPALAVNPDIAYVKVKQGEEYYILAKSTLKILTEDPYEVVEEYKGKDLLGKKFEPHYSFYEIEKGKKAFEIIGGDFVTAEDGTGIVTIAAYGEDDLRAMKENNIQIVLHVDDEGRLKPEVPNWAGEYYLDVNEKVNADLASRGLMYKEESYTHSIPTCWRCHTRLYYAPLDAWFVDIAKLRPALKENNKQINWFPEHFKNGRFAKSIEAAPDWCISRNRYWGSPVPVWECECGARVVIGSVAELEEKSGQKITTLHKPEIDDVTIKCEKCGKQMHRVPEILDTWIEAGSASFAERHFPFDETQKLEDFFPPDFITEYTGQIRAWFYVLHVISTALYDSEAFKNVVVSGVILGTDGRKMSKNYGNYPDPRQMIQTYGGDALRLYLMGSTVMRGEDIRISEEDYRNWVRGFLLMVWNVYNYFVTYSNLDGWKPEEAEQSEHVLDKWIISMLNQLVVDVTESLDGYDTPTAVGKLRDFVGHLSNWYVRRSRDRSDKENFYNTMYGVLVTFTKLMAPIAPFIAEKMFKNLTKEESVHLEDWPLTDTNLIDKKLMLAMEEARKIVEMGHAIRKDKQLKVRQPLQKATIANATEDLGIVSDIIASELNVKEVQLAKGDGALSVELDTTITSELKDEGEARELIRQIQGERKNVGTKLDEYVNVTLPAWPESFEEEIKSRALIKNLSKGEFKVERIG